MRKLILSAAVGAAAAFFALAATPASAQSGGVPEYCYTNPDFFYVACQGLVALPGKGYIGKAPPPMRGGYECPPCPPPPCKTES